MKAIQFFDRNWSSGLPPLHHHLALLCEREAVALIEWASRGELSEAEWREALRPLLVAIARRGQADDGIRVNIVVVGGDMVGAVIVSNDAANRYLNRVQVVPLSGSVDRLYPGEACVTFNDRPGKARADQLPTGSQQRLSHQPRRLSATAELQRVEQVIKVRLALG